MSNKKRKAKILRATVKYLRLKTARHERILRIQMDALKEIEAGLKRLVLATSTATTLKQQGDRNEIQQPN